MDNDPPKNLHSHDALGEINPNIYQQMSKMTELAKIRIQIALFLRLPLPLPYRPFSKMERGEIIGDGKKNKKHVRNFKNIILYLLQKNSAVFEHF